MAELPNPARVARGRPNLSAEIASRSTDPLWYSGLGYLPNPDPILRKAGKTQVAYDAIASDAHVLGELRAIRAGLLSFEWRVTPPEAPSAQERAAAALCEARLTRPAGPGYQWTDAIWHLAGAVFWGYAVHELTWRREDRVLVPTLHNRPARRFVWDPDGAPRLLTRNDQIQGEPLGPWKWILARHMPSYDNPYGAPAFGACFWPYTFKHAGWRFLVKLAQKYGLPWPVGKYPEGTADTQIDQLVTRLAQMIEDGVAAIPDGNSVELVEAKSAGGMQPVQERVIVLANREMSKALTSQTLATEIVGSQGSRAAAETHAEREAKGASSDRVVIEQAMGELFGMMTALNYGPGVRAPIFEFYEEGEARQGWAETLDLARGFLEIPKAAAYQRLQIDPPEDGEEILPMETTPGARLLDRTTGDTATGRRSQTGGGAPAGRERAAEMARGCPACGRGHEFRAAEPDDPVRALAEQAAADGDGLIVGLVEGARRALAESASLEDYRERLAALDPELDDAQLAEFLRQAMLAAHLVGQDRADG